jgi:HK97 family phage portal protein
MPAKALPFAWPSWRADQPQWHLVDYETYAREGYGENTLIYSAISYKHRALTAAPLRAYTGSFDDREVLPDQHPLASLLARPNEYQSWEEFQGLNVVYLNIAGDCYVYVDRTTTTSGVPAQLVSLRPDRVYVVPTVKDGKATLFGFVYVPEGRTAWGKMTEPQRMAQLQAGRAVPLLPDDVMHVKLPNPLDPLEGMGYGMSPIAPAARSVDVDNAITDFIDLFFKRGGVPPFWFTYDMPLDDNVMATLREQVNDMYGGYSNWTRPGILDQGGDIKRLGLTFDEMGFGGLDQRNESRILGPFGVPPILIGSRVGLERATYSNYEEARRAFWEDTMIPESRLFEVEYQHYLRVGDAWPAFDYTGVPALQNDVPALADAAYKLWQMGVSAASAFASVGLSVDDYVGADQSYVPMSVVPVSGQLPPTDAAKARRVPKV